MGIIQCYDNLSDKIALYWPALKSSGIGSFGLYFSKRKSGPYTFVKNVANVPSLDPVNAYVEVSRANDISVGPTEQVYFKYTTKPIGGVESALVDDSLKVVYPQNIQLQTDPYIVEADVQASGATDVDFTSTDRFSGLLLQVIVSRDTTNPINVDISIKSASKEVVLENIIASTDKSIVLDYNQNIVPYDSADVRVVTSGVSGGSMTVEIGRKRIYLPTMGI